MGWPKQINVCGHVYSVEYVDDPERVNPDSNDHHYGYTNTASKSVRIWDCEDRNIVLNTLIHEIVHAVIAETPAVDETIGEEEEEKLAGQLSSTMADTLIRNEIWTWVRE